MSNPSVTAVSPDSADKLPLQVAVATLSRLVMNTSRRFMYPFAPALSRGLAVPLTSITSLIAINQFTGILSPLFGPLSDRWGYRVMMMAGLGVVAVGMIAGGFLPWYGIILMALFMAGVGKSIFDPALQAYVGERVPFERRGLVIGLIETSWAGASLIGIPLVGLAIQQWGWQSPFLILGGLALLGTVGLGLVLPKVSPPQKQQTAKKARFFEVWRHLAGNRAAWGMLGFGFFISMANDVLFVVYGVWLEKSFALGLVALGTATIVIGLAELLGEALTASVSDKIGLKRAVIIGLVLSTCSYMLLPLIGTTLILALVGLFITFVTFEFAIVTSLSFITEVLPQARATMMSSFIATTGLGRVVGALLGGSVWLWGDLLMVGAVATGLSFLSLLFFLWGLRYWQVETR